MSDNEKQAPCSYFRKTEDYREHRCADGDCYYGDTEETRKFGNCCWFCPKKNTCEARCGVFGVRDETVKELNFADFKHRYLELVPVVLERDMRMLYADYCRSGKSFEEWVRGEKHLRDEQAENDAFVKLVGSVQRADRLQQIWNTSYPQGTELGRLYGKAKTKEVVFRENAKAEGYTDKQIDAFLNLP